MVKLDVHEFPDRLIDEPRKRLKRDEQLAPGHQEPEPVCRDVGDLSDESAFSTRRASKP